MKRNLRALSRTPKGIATVSELLWDAYVRKPEGDAQQQSAKKFFKGVADVFGMNIVLGPNSVPQESDYPTLIVANHSSVADFIVAGNVLDNIAFAGKVLGLPKKLEEGVNYIAIRRVPKDHPDFARMNRETMGMFVNTLNGGKSVQYYPEGTTTDGSLVAMFRSAMLRPIYDPSLALNMDGTTTSLQQEVRVQPMAIRVLDVEGHPIEERPDKRHYYAHYTTKDQLKRIWQRMQTESLTVEVTLLPSLDPKDFQSADDIANAAGASIRKIVAPHQSVVDKARIPGVAERGEAPTAPPPKPKGFC